jgi:uncharacterized protein YndB with AHSA1/START domain
MSAQAGGPDFVIARAFDAPRERLWQALTDPECMKVWWPPKGFTMIAATMELGLGGSFHCGMRSLEGYKMWAKFVYREIAPLERLVFVSAFSSPAGEIKRHPIVPTWPMTMLTTLRFDDEPEGKAKLTVIWTPHEATDVEWNTFNISHVGMKATWAATFDRLGEYLAKTA